MKKYILTILTIIFSLTFAPCVLDSIHARVEFSEIENQQVRIELIGNHLVVTGAQGKTVHIYNLVGMEVMAIKIDATEKKIDLSNLKKVVHLVKVGNISKKINLLGR